MKLILDIQDNKVPFFMELLHNFRFIKAKPISDEKALFFKELGEAVEEVNEIKYGGKKARNAQDFLNEL